MAFVRPSKGDTFLLKSSETVIFSCKVLDKLSEIGAKAQEGTQMINVLRYGEVLNAFSLDGIGGNALFRNENPNIS